MTLAVGQAGATAIAVLLSPVLTRLYSPEAFGPVTLLTSLVATLSVFGTWSYYRALALARTPAAKRAVFTLCCVIAGVMTLLIGVLTAVGGEYFVNLYEKPELLGYLAFLPILFFFTAIGQVITIGLNCEHRHKTVAARTMLEKAGAISGQIALGAFVTPGMPLGLIVGSLGGTILGAIWGIRGVTVALFSGATYQVRAKSLIAAARRYHQLPGVYTWSQFLSAAGMNAPAIVMGAFFPLEVVGAYALGYRILKLPSFLFTKASSQIFYVEAADSLRQGEGLAQKTLDLLSMLSRVSAAPMIVMLFMAPPLFALAFGKQWYSAGVYAQVLAPWVMVTVIGTPLLSLLSAQERYLEALSYTAMLFILRIGTLCVGGTMFGPVVTLAMYSAVNCVFWIVVLARVLRLADIGYASAASAILPWYAVAVAALIPGSVIFYLFEHQGLGVAISIGGSVLAGVISTRSIFASASRSK